MPMQLAEMREKIYMPSPQELAREQVWINEKIEAIGLDKLNELIQSAVDVRLNAYPPHSGYMVGASVLSKSGAIYSSCNAEVVTYTETDHAERSAITKAISEGEIKKSDENFIEAVVVSHPGESGPCGGCRQRIAQHCDNALIIDVDGDGKVQAVTSLKILFPYAFTPAHLK